MIFIASDGQLLRFLKLETQVPKDSRQGAEKFTGAEREHGPWIANHQLRNMSKDRAPQASGFRDI